LSYTTDIITGSHSFVIICHNQSYVLNERFEPIRGFFMRRSSMIPPLAALPRLLALLLVLSAAAACGSSSAAPALISESVGVVAAAPIADTVAVSATSRAAAAPAEAAAMREPPAQVAMAAPLAAAEPANQRASQFYNGEIVARAEVNVVAEVGGEVLAVAVKVGDHIRAGDLLVTLDRVRLEAQAAQALAGLEAAQAQLDQLTTPAKAADLAAAKAAVSAAAAAYRTVTGGPTEEDLRLAEAQLRAAQAGVTAAQAAYNRVKGDMNIETRTETLQLQQAKLQVEAAQARYDQLTKGATQDVIAGAYARLAQAQAMLKNLENGPDAEQIRALQAQVQQAEAALYLAQMQVSKADIRAPIAGVVSRVATSPGAMAGSGALMVVLFSEEVEVIIPVEELRAPQLQVGQPATIQVAAYPERFYTGEVAIIAPKLDPATRTLRVTIRPTQAASELLPGMFATVELFAP
jgi:multidrug efflux pump subunit AcrA (membrane-fusion protein)